MKRLRFKTIEIYLEEIQLGQLKEKLQNQLKNMEKEKKELDNLVQIFLKMLVLWRKNQFQKLEVEKEKIINKKI